MAKRGRKPIADAVKERILARYAVLKSTRQVARETGVHRKTVQNVVHGRHCQPGLSESSPKLNPGEVRVVATRCPLCGHLVSVRPCRECLAAVFGAANRRQALRELIAESERRAGLSLASHQRRFSQ